MGSNFQNAKHRVIEAMKVFAKEKQEIPTKLYVDLQLELEMCLLESTDVGTELARAILRDGPRKALDDLGGTFLGLAITWGAPSFKVE